MKKGDILRLEDKLYLLVKTAGTGKEKVFQCIKYTADEKRYLSKILPDLRFHKKELKEAEVVEHYSPRAKKAGVIQLKNGNEPFDWWEKYKLTEPTIKEFVCKLVEKYGHPYAHENTYLKSFNGILKGMTNDERTQEEIYVYPYYIYNDLSPKQVWVYMMDEIRKYVKPCTDLYGHKTLDYDYDQIAYAWVVEKYYGNIRGEPVPKYKYYHQRFPEDERFAGTKLIKDKNFKSEDVEEPEVKKKDEKRSNRKSNSRKR